MDLCSAPKSQAYEMLWCTSQCGNINGTSTPSSGTNSTGSSPDVSNQPYLTFDDYSTVFAAEMKRAHSTEKGSSAPASKIPHKNNDHILPSASDFIHKCNEEKSSMQCEVFLGGACNPTTWRQDIAIPLLNNLGISLFNPQVTDWEPGLIELEHQARENADVLFYVIDNQTRCVVVMIEVAYFVAKHRNVVLVINGFKEPGSLINNEPISQIEFEDLTYSQMILQELVERHGIPVFNDIPTALNCTAKIIREKIRPQEFQLSELAQPTKKGLFQIGNKLINLRKTFENLDSKSIGEVTLHHVRMAYQILTNGELTKDVISNALDRLKRRDDQDLIHSRKDVLENNEEKREINGVNGTALNFDQFCYVMSELMVHRHRNPAKNLSNLLSNKANNLAQSVSSTLAKLLDHVKPGWMPDSSKQEAEEAVSHSVEFDVYLGGEASSEDWRSDAISFFKERGLTYHNPTETNTSCSKSIPIDKTTIDSCRVILFNIPSSRRSTEFMTMAAYYFGLGYRVVVCMGYLPEDCQIQEEKLSKLAIKDYNRGRSYLADMASRENIPIFEDLKEALQCVTEKCNNLKSIAEHS